jgi:hypothetical protein
MWICQIDIEACYAISLFLSVVVIVHPYYLKIKRNEKLQNVHDSQIWIYFIFVPLLLSNDAEI